MDSLELWIELRVRIVIPEETVPLVRHDDRTRNSCVLLSHPHMSVLPIHHIELILTETIDCFILR